MFDKHSLLAGILCAWGLLTSGSPVQGQATITSDFESGPDGWTTVNLTSLSSPAVCTTGTTAQPPDWMPSGGDPGGHIVETDTATVGNFFFEAPSEFVGDKSNWFGGQLSFSIRPMSCSPINHFFDVFLCGGGTTLRGNLPAPTGFTWNFQSVALDSSANWSDLGTGVAATDATIQTVLGSLDRLLILGDFCSGLDTSALDSVNLAPPPPPEFVRGDCNTDGLYDIADPIYNLAYQFTLGPSLCLDAHDVNDDGMVDISDPIYDLNHQFTGGPPPPAPFSTCESDPTADMVECVQFDACP